MSKAFVISGALSTIMFIFYVAVLSDGRALMTSKNTPYAAGMFRDQFGMEWQHDQHILRPCGDHVPKLRTAGAFMILSTAVASFVPLLSLLGMATGKGTWGKLSVGLNLFMAVLLIITFSLCASRFETTLRCYGNVTKLLDAYHANYAIPIMLIGFICSLINAVLLVMMGGTQDRVAEEAQVDKEMEETN
eukprot:TRINITY_DN3246_c0_g1_i1.p2 TRINITY_DN3246_c0_g1~~TRINITY_DN3246_c0_g1_i1.p2  ORF type:complete len:190 (+),score=84.16 TRINITY_DN3246_c0_g1_i1:162-731(+)